jgi:protein O-GlcNAc transferase
VKIDPSQPSYWVNLAAALRDQYQWPEAIVAYRRSLALEPGNAATWQALAVVEQEAGNLKAAQDAFERALAIAPGGEATIGISYLWSTRGQPQRAILLLHDYLTKNPNSAMAWMVLAHALKHIGQPDRAEAAFRQSLQLSPRLLESRQQLVELLAKRWALTDAEAAARSLVTDEPQYSPGWTILGFVLLGTAQPEEAIAALRHSLEIDPQKHPHSQLLCALQYADGLDAAKLREAHEEWDAAWGRNAALPEPPRVLERKANRKLKLGFVSGDFCRHPVSFLVLPALENLDKDRCSVVCYSDRSEEDEYTARFRAACEYWRNIHCHSDDDVERQIREDEIDVLFDLTGHWGARMSLFARKPAPIQITWLGYVGTTGLKAMDYILADSHHIRPGEESSHTETVLRMPHDYACFGPSVNACQVTPPPATTGEPFTFGSFNHPAKLCQLNFLTWAKILRQVPRSRLLIKYGGLDDRGMQQRILTVLAAQGIDPDRISLEGWTNHSDLLAAYGRVDLSLDTQPYSGGLTTCEALWMGVPVVTWPGQTFAGRHATSHLTNAGLTQFIADSRESYIDLAVQWASRIDELTELRLTLRERMQASPLCSARQFAADLLQLLQTVTR